VLWLGIDDTDTLETPGTNKLALALVGQLSDVLTVRLVVRHQLFLDSRVPYTSHNGSASLWAEPVGSIDVPALAARLRRLIVDWCPPGSDPGLCIARHVPPEITAFGQRCQRDLVTQDEAHALARRHAVHLESIGGTGDGVIGALAAVGLLATRNDGRVLHFGTRGIEPFDVKGNLSVAEVLQRGVERVEDIDTGASVGRGTVALAKRLRPNLRDGKLVLFVRPHAAAGDSDWQAVKVV
jgi:hypothetical protein